MAKSDKPLVPKGGTDMCKIVRRNGFTIFK